MAEGIEIPILWEDKEVVVIDKPSGVISLPDGFDRSIPHLRSILEPELGRLWIVHRLDRETSGAIVLARTAESHRMLNTQFQEGSVHKIYLALVIGSPEWEFCEVDLPLLPDGDRRHRTIVDHRRGKQARTVLKVLKRFDAFSLVEAHPKTGRTHQIRAHLSEVNHPILNDGLYGLRGDPANQLISRLGLHASRLSFQHPTRDDLVEIEAPQPPDFAFAVD